MFNAQGKPRYWLGTYDAWHLLIPVALAVVIVIWGLAPKPVQTRRTIAPVLAPLTPSTITQPTAGSTLLVRQFTSIQGTTHPQARVFLFLRQIPNPEQILAETRSGTNGLFQFTMAPFPPGDFGFRVEAVAADGRRAPSTEISVRLMAEPPPPPPPPPTRKAPANKVAPKVPAKKAPVAKPAGPKQSAPAKKPSAAPATPK
jgi:hypothetical protein